MAIPETQLETWSKIGSATQSKNTYATISNALRTKDAPYAGKSYDTFLQGSYGNDTNVWADSDVDVVIRLDEIFFRDLSRLSPSELALYNASFAGGVAYSFADFKRDVIVVLRKQFGADVNSGNKAVWIKPNGGRRNTDVVVAAQFRRYYAFPSFEGQQFATGIAFLNANDTLIENFPKQHSERCTKKHQATKQWFKPTVRIFKNMRNRMIADRLLADGDAPSYFIEGMLHNVPDDKFGHSYDDTFVACFNWIVESDSTHFTCANNMYWLVRDGEQTSWPTQKFSNFLAATRTLWNQW